MPPHVVIDPEITFLLTPHTAEELTLLARSVRDHGCREPLAIWRGTGMLLDCHACFRICTEHGIAFEAADVVPPGREAAGRWVPEWQPGLRNPRTIAGGRR